MKKYIFLILVFFVFVGCYKEDIIEPIPDISKSLVDGKIEVSCVPANRVVVVSEGENAFFSVYYKSELDVTAKVTKNGKEIKEPIAYISGSSNSIHVEIKVLRIQDAGIYEVELINGYTTVKIVFHIIVNQSGT